MSTFPAHRLIGHTFTASDNHHPAAADFAVPPGAWFPILLICLSLGFAFFFSKKLEEKIVIKKGGSGAHGCPGLSLLSFFL